MNAVLFLLATDLNPPGAESLILKGLEYAYVESFAQADAWFDSVRRTWPDNPAGWFFKAALLQVYMMDGCRTDREAEYYELIDSTVEKASRIAGSEKNPWAQYYLGSASTYRAVFEGSKKNYWVAFSLGMKGGKIMKRLIENYPEFYDAYLGAGSYDYFWARASRYLPVLRLVGDFTKGATEITAAMNKSTYSKITGQNALVWIYTQEGRFTEGIELARDLVKDYPNSRTFLWSMGGIFLASKQYEDAIGVFERLYSIYDSLNEKNYANLAQCRLYVARCLFELDRTEECLKTCDEVIGFYRYRSSFPQITNYVNEAKSIKKCL